MTNCVHHWLLDEPSAELCHGKCKKCGAERNDFVNVADHTTEFYINSGTIDYDLWRERQGTTRRATAK